MQLYSFVSLVSFLLTMPLRKSPDTLLNLAVEKFVPYFFMNTIVVGDKVLSPMPFVPPNVFTKVVSKIIKYFSQTKNLRLGSEFSITSMFPALLTSSLTHFDIEPLLTCSNFSFSPRNSYVVFDRSDIKLAFENCLPNLKNIVHLSLESVCSNSILYEIAENCNALVYLNIQNNYYVSDSGLARLAPSTKCAGCPNLKEININGCSVTENGVRTLLKKIPGIKSVTYPHMGSILYELAKDKACQTLQLRRVSLYDVTSIEFLSGTPDGREIRTRFRQIVESIGKLCPELRSVDVCVKDEEIPLLCNFKDLSELMLKHYLTFPGGESTIKYFSACGSKLTVLVIDCTLFDSRFFTLFGKCCYNLSELSISCEIVVNDSSSEDECVWVDGVYPVLSKFSFYVSKGELCVIPIELLCNVLRNTDCLTELTLSFRNDMFTDSSLECLLDCINKSSLLHLNINYTAYVKPEKSIRLTILSVELILDGCPKLKTLGNLYMWDVDPVYVWQLKQDLKASNFDIRIISEDDSIVVF